MKKAILLSIFIICILFISKTHGQENSPKPITASLDFESKDFDFGSVKDGEKVVCEFTYTNTGNDFLIISGVATSCGCTVAEWSRKPVKPGAQGKVRVVFDTKGKKGIQQKTIALFSNASTSHERLTIRGKIVEGVALASTE